MQKPTQKCHNSGFSLVEIAIVLTIMGLIIGGIIGGAALKRNLQITAVMDKTSKLVESINKFRQIYGGWPGDLWNATDRFGHTDELGNTIYNGNGNGVVDTIDDHLDSNEQGRMMHQLALAGLIEGGYNGTNWAVSNIIYGPIDKNSIFTIQGGSVAEPVKVQFFGVADDDDSGTLDATDGTYRGVFTPTEMLKVDTKYDDGQPLTGKIRAKDGLAVIGSCVNVGVYALSNSERTCYMEVIIENQF